MRLLVVDDHDIVRKGVCALLSACAGVEICGEAADGHEAISMARDLQPDVIIMDVTMPKLDGFAAAREIKKFLPSVPIIFLSMHDGPAAVLQAKLAGGQAYIRKSEATSDLPKALKAAIRGIEFFAPR